MNLQERLLLSRLLIKDTASKYDPKQTNILWSGGKDSTVLLHLIRKTLHKVPFHVVRVDTGIDFPEVYQFVERITKEWNLTLDTIQLLSPQEKKDIASVKDEEEVRKYIRIKRDGAVKKFIKESRITASFSGIRWYENFHNIQHFWGEYLGINMVYPILHWTHNDIMEYTRLYKVPRVSLYEEGYTHLDSMWFSYAKKTTEKKI